jgi:hypothetical protein
MPLGCRCKILGGRPHAQGAGAHGRLRANLLILKPGHGVLSLGIRTKPGRAPSARRERAGGACRWSVAGLLSFEPPAGPPPGTPAHLAFILTLKKSVDNRPTLCDSVGVGNAVNH